VTHWSAAWLAGSTALEVIAASAGSREQIEGLRRERLARLLAHAALHSPLYKSVLGQTDTRRLRLHELPVMTKAGLMRDFDRWVADPAVTRESVQAFMADRGAIAQDYLGRYQVWESSGSTGEPGVFIQDAQALAVYDALEIARRPVLDPGRRALDPWYVNERSAFVGATNGHFASIATVQRLRRLNPWLALNVRSFSFLEPVPLLVRSLNEFSPTVLMSYPSVALILAEECRAGRLAIALREIWTGGESLSATMREFIEQAFACPVAQSYGASEFLSLASECAHGRLHLNSDWAILESVDARGRPVNDGEAGSTVLLTNLANQVQPLIRYDLGDRVRLQAAPCACGSPLPVIDVHGRVDDGLSMADGRGHKVRLPGLALVTVLEEDAGVFDFQLRQVSDVALDLLLAEQGPNDDARLSRAMEALLKYLRAQHLPKVSVRGHRVTSIDRGRSGKIKRVVEHVDKTATPREPPHRSMAGHAPPR
jgi:putative adenylate-forming enzyme